MKINRRWLALVPAVVALAIALVVSSTSGAASKSGAAKSDVSGSITVWVDAPREPYGRVHQVASERERDEGHLRR